MNKNYWKWRSDLAKLVGELVGCVDGLAWHVQEKEERENVREILSRLREDSDKLLGEYHDDTETS